MLTVVATLIVCVACDALGDNDRDLEPGFTACGDSTCQPGQYCANENLSVCENGCTSDANCEEGHVCEDINDVTGQGTCSESPENDDEPGDPPADSLQACLDACNDFADCGMQGSDYNDCLNTCPDLSENQQRTVARCGEGTCAQALNCLELECFSDADCTGANDSCLGGRCV